MHRCPLYRYFSYQLDAVLILFLFFFVSLANALFSSSFLPSSSFKAFFVRRETKSKNSNNNGKNGFEKEKEG